MMPEAICDRIQAEMSAAHDEHRPLEGDLAAHVAECAECSAFGEQLLALDDRLARDDVSRAPKPTVPTPPTRSKQPTGWWWVAAAAVIGVVAGAMMAGLGRVQPVQAQDLGDRLHRASPSVSGLRGGLLVVERGWHPDVPERVYTGTLSYSAPEHLAIDLVDTTTYPGPAWSPNNLELTIADGDLVSKATSPCPLDALPACQPPPVTVAYQGLKPFDQGVVAPLEMIGPGRSLNWWSGLDVLGHATLDGRDVVQVQTTVAGADMIRAITSRGAWRQFYPTDRVLMWLDADTLVPVRLEVFAADTPQRNLWQIRRGYDDPTDRPILIVSLENLTVSPSPVTVDVPPGARSGGFVDGPATVPTPDLEDGFEPHRFGRWSLPEGGQVRVGSWSDGRSWLMVQATGDWTRPELFGISGAFAQQVDLGGGSVGYLNPRGDAVSVHDDNLDLVVSGSVSRQDLLDTAASLGVTGRPVPTGWTQATTVDPAQLPSGILVPRVEGWSILATTDGRTSRILLTGTGSRTVLITVTPGDQLEPPAGPDVVATRVRGHQGRFDAATSTLEWVEDDQIIQMTSDTVGREELTRLAQTMAPS